MRLSTVFKPQRDAIRCSANHVFGIVCLFSLPFLRLSWFANGNWCLETIFFASSRIYAHTFQLCIQIVCKLRSRLRIISKCHHRNSCEEASLCDWKPSKGTQRETKRAKKKFQGCAEGRWHQNFDKSAYLVNSQWTEISFFLPLVSMQFSDDATCTRSRAMHSSQSTVYCQRMHVGI